MKKNKFLAASLATLFTVGNMGWTIYAQPDTEFSTVEFESSANVQADFQSVWNEICSQNGLTYTLNIIGKDGFVKSVQHRSFKTSTPELINVYTSNSDSSKKYYEVKIHPTVEDGLFLCLDPTRTDTGETYIFTKDDSQNYIIQKEYANNLTDLSGNTEAGIAEPRIYDFVAWELPDTLNNVVIHCKSNTTGKSYAITMNPRLLNISRSVYLQEWLRAWMFPDQYESNGRFSEGELAPGNFYPITNMVASIPFSSLTQAVQSQVGSNKKITFTSYTFEYPTPQSPDIPALKDPKMPTLQKMLENNELTGPFHGNFGGLAGYLGSDYTAPHPTTNDKYEMLTDDGYRVVFHFNETRTNSGSSSSSSSSSKPSTAPSKPAETPVNKPMVSSTPKESYRLYNSVTGEHFFTTSKAEYDSLSADGNWKPEVSTWKSPEISDFPIYRVCNPNTGDHHYTMSIDERDALVRFGWKDEGIGMYSADEAGEPVLRLYNPNSNVGSHHYTTSIEEKDALVQMGWQFEGTGFYGLK